MPRARSRRRVRRCARSSTTPPSWSNSGARCATTRSSSTRTTPIRPTACRAEETSEAIRFAARTEAMITDPVYEGKSMQGMIDLVRKGFFPEGSQRALRAPRRRAGAQRLQLHLPERLGGTLDGPRRLSRGSKGAGGRGGLMATDPVLGARKKVRLGEEALTRGQGGELHQVADGDTPVLTTQQGIPVADDQNSLRLGARGPTLLEDFHFREKIFHFDHERIPERVVHARGFGAHGYFETYESLSRRHPRRSVPAQGREDRRPSSASRPSPAARARPISRATCAASRSSSTPRKATGTWSATTSRCSSSRTRSSFPI